MEMEEAQIMGVRTMADPTREAQEDPIMVVQGDRTAEDLTMEVLLTTEEVLITEALQETVDLTHQEVKLDLTVPVLRILALIILVHPVTDLQVLQEVVAHRLLRPHLQEVDLALADRTTNSTRSASYTRIQTVTSSFTVHKFPFILASYLS